MLPHDDAGVKKVLIEFGGPISELLMEPGKAREFAESIMTVANRIDGRRLSLPPGAK